MNIRKIILRIAVAFPILILCVILFSPLISLFFADSSLGRHAYHEISFQVIAMNELPDYSSEMEVIRDAMEYTRSHLRHYFSDSRPYSGKPFDYLIEGVGWCDYQAKVLSKLLAAKGIHSRYAFLMVDNNVANSPHTLAEVYTRGKWLVVDPLHGIIYLNNRGEVLTLEEITPEIFAGLPGVNPGLMGLAKRVYPIPHPPIRSQDFLSEKHIFDLMANKYVQIFGLRFANFYQDAFLALKAPKIKDPAARMLYKARNYDLYGRKQRALLLYRQILDTASDTIYAEKAELFLREILGNK